MATEKPKAKKTNLESTRKTSKKKVAKKATAAKKSSSIRVKSTAKPNSTKRKQQISPEERLEMIRTAAYYLAEKRGYHGNNELADWFEAEKQIGAIR